MILICDECGAEMRKVIELEGEYNQAGEVIVTAVNETFVCEDCNVACELVEDENEPTLGGAIRN